MFAFSGTVGFLVDAGMLYVLLRLGLGFYAGRLASFLTAVYVTWRINRRFTFGWNSRSPSWAEWSRYLLAMSGGGVCNYAAYVAVLPLAAAAGPWRPLIAVAVGSAAGMAVNFVGAKWWVFGRRHADQESVESPDQTRRTR